MGYAIESMTRIIGDKVVGTFRVSRRGVPHVIVTDIATNERYSIAFMGKKKVWRVFHPYGVFGGQSRFDFKTMGEVVDFFKDIPRN